MMRQSYKQQDSIPHTGHFENHVFYDLIFQFLKNWVFTILKGTEV